MYQIRNMMTYVTFFTTVKLYLMFAVIPAFSETSEKLVVLNTQNVTENVVDLQTDERVFNAVSALSEDLESIKSFYKSIHYKPMWIGGKNESRHNAFLDALKRAGDHGLPVARYNISDLEAALSEAKLGQNVGTTEVMITQTYLQYAHDLSSGALEPKKIDIELSIERPRKNDEALLTSIFQSEPGQFLSTLAPQSDEYQKLLAEKEKLEHVIADAGVTEPLPARTLKKGSSGEAVVLLRNRLTTLGYSNLGTGEKFDEDLKAAVIKYQQENGLSADGVVGPGTLGHLNQGPREKLIKVLVNLERERWMNFKRGQRNVIVNQASFMVYLVDDGRVSFETRAVVGKRSKDRTPEFYDEMTHMVVNPTWHVPKSIAGQEFLPMMKKDPSVLARRNMVMISRSGKRVNPADLDLTQFSSKNFPFSIKQRPSAGNALGRVKFMFPNKFNIYLHDTPMKSLFKRDVRAFSHGCVRLQKPFEFAHKLLELQTSNPEGAFDRWLKTRKEQYVNLEHPVPVYLTYRTAYFGDASEVSFHPDIYGRDKKVFDALTKAGFSLEASQS